MGDEHLDETLLLLYSDSPELVSDRLAIEEHLRRCAPCSDTVAEFKALSAAQRDEETWWNAREIVEGRGRRAINDFAERCAREDADAERLLRPFLESPYRFASANITRKKRFQTGGVVRLLCAGANEQCDYAPLFALELADTACAIAEALPDDYYPARAVNELRGTAWKEYATACRYLGDFANGFHALDKAEAAYRHLSVSPQRLAVVALARAVLFWTQQKYDEALRHIRTAETSFAAFGDTGRYLDARNVEGVILQRKGDIVAARETYRSILDVAETLNDPLLKAQSSHNLGVLYRDGGDTASASSLLLDALQLYEALDVPTEALRTRWAIAQTALTAGDFTRAVENLADVEQRFERLGMMGEVHLAKLDRAEGLLMLGRLDEVEVICCVLVVYFGEANMVSGALTAMSFIAEAAAQRTLNRRKLQAVRKYLAHLEWQPDLAFVPPAEPE